MIIFKTIASFLLAILSLFTVIFFAMFYVYKARSKEERVIFCLVIFNLSAAMVFFIATGVLVLEGILK